MLHRKRTEHPISSCVFDSITASSVKAKKKSADEYRADFLNNSIEISELYQGLACHFSRLRYSHEF